MVNKRAGAQQDSNKTDQDFLQGPTQSGGGGDRVPANQCLVETESSASSDSDGGDDDDAQSHSDFEDNDDDPVVREYDVILNDDLLTKRLMLLQYPNRDCTEPYKLANYAKPTELRIKSQAGLIEVDIPMEVFDNYDREKAVRFGEALRKSTEERAGGSLGLPGGFGIGSMAGGGGVGAGRGGIRRAAGEGDSGITQEMLVADFVSANAVGRVLNKQTLGGQINPAEDGKPILMLGGFRNGQVHLSSIDAIAQLRPQFHHIDALVDQERANARIQREATNSTRQQEARAVQMTVKAADGDDMDTAATTKTLKAAQEESWRRLAYVDEETKEAWDAFNRVFVGDTATVPELLCPTTRSDYLNDVNTCKRNVIRGGNKTARKTDKEPAPNQQGRDTDEASAQEGKAKGTKRGPSIRR